MAASSESIENECVNNVHHDTDQSGLESVQVDTITIKEIKNQDVIPLNDLTTNHETPIISVDTDISGKDAGHEVVVRQENPPSASPDGQLNCRPASTATASTPTGGANDSEYESVDEGDNESSSESHKLVQDKEPTMPSADAADSASAPAQVPTEPVKEPSVEISITKSQEETVPVIVKSDPVPIPSKSPPIEVKREGSISPSKTKTSRKFDSSWADENADIAMPGALDDLNPVPEVVDAPKDPTPVPEASSRYFVIEDAVKVGQDNDEVVDVEGNDEEPPSYEEEDDFEEAASRSDRGSLRSRSRTDPYSESDREQSIGSRSVSVSEEEDNGPSNGEEPTEEKSLDDDEDRKNPQYIPKRGAFYEHDDRLGPDDEVVTGPGGTTVDTNAAGEAVDDVQEEEKSETVKEINPDAVVTAKDKTSSADAAKEPLSPPSADRSVTSSAPSSATKKSSKRRETMETDHWGHDMFREDEQKPKSKDELVTSYGYDIRDEDSAPKARRRRRYAHGPVKYTRSWQDQDAYTGHGDERRAGGGGGGKGSDSRKKSGVKDADGGKIIPADDRGNVVVQSAAVTVAPVTPVTPKDTGSTSSGQQIKSSGSKSRAMDKIALREAHQAEERKKYQRNMEEKDMMAKSYARRPNSGNKKLFVDRDQEPQPRQQYRDGPGGNRDSGRGGRDNRGPRRDNRDHNRDDHFQQRPQQQQPRNRNRNSFQEDEFPELVPSVPPSKGNITVTIRNNSSASSNGTRAWTGETRTEPMKVIEALESKMEQQQQMQQQSNRREPIRSLTFSNSNYSRNRRNDGDGDQRRSGYREERARSDAADRRQQQRRNDGGDRRGNNFNQRRGDGRGGDGGDRGRKSGPNIGNRPRQMSHEHDDRFDDGDHRMDEINSNMNRLSIETVNNNKSRTSSSTYREVTVENDQRPKRYSALRQQPQHQSSRSMSPSDDMSLSSTTSSSRHNLHQDPSQQHLLNQGQGHSQPSPPIHSHQSQSQYYDHHGDPRSPDQHGGNFYDGGQSTGGQQQQIGQFPDPGSAGQFMPHPMAHQNQGRFLPDPHHGPLSRSGSFPHPPGMTPSTGPQSTSGPLPVIPGPGPSFLPSFPPSGYPQYPPPAPAPSSASYHQTMVPPAAVLPGIPVQNTGPSTAPPGLGGPELYRGGVTYYDTSQQQAIMRSLPPKRPKNIIPIVPPPDGRNNPGSADGHNYNSNENNSGY